MTFHTYLSIVLLKVTTTMNWIENDDGGWDGSEYSAFEIQNLNLKFSCKHCEILQYCAKT